jgi:hypothetical protein
MGKKLISEQMKFNLISPIKYLKAYLVAWACPCMPVLKYALNRVFLIVTIPLETLLATYLSNNHQHLSKCGPRDLARVSIILFLPFYTLQGNNIVLNIFNCLQNPVLGTT